MRHCASNDVELALAIEQTGEIEANTERVLKSHLKSPVYVDGRGFVSFPRLLANLGRRFLDVLEGLKFDIVAGIPMAGQPLAQAISREHLEFGNEIPNIWIREGVKDYGTKKAIEGRWEPGQTCVLIDNVITDGASKLEYIQPLRAPGVELVVTDVVVLVDREQGGAELLAQHGIKLHSIWTLRSLIQLYTKARIITPDRERLIMAYLDEPLSYTDNRAIKEANDKEAERKLREEHEIAERRRIMSIMHGND